MLSNYMLSVPTIIMNWRLLMALHLFLVLFMHISLVQLLALNPETANATVTCIERERQALLSLKRGFQLTKDRLSSWGDGENQKECCNWKGVQCSNETGHVLMLDLHADGDYVVISSISPSLGELHYLNYLDLSNNVAPRESIPNVIGSLTHLRHLNLSNCDFQGKIPHELGNLPFLEYLDLQNNYLQGQIPSQFSDLSHLVYLDLSWNFLDGKIPPLVTNMSLLRYLDLSVNGFSGSMPPWLGNLLSLEYLDLSANNFIGTIPFHFRNLSNLQYLDLNSYGRRPVNLFTSSRYLSKNDDMMSLSSDLHWLSHLSSLRYLSLPKVNLTRANSWLSLLSGLSHLQYLNLSGCSLLDSDPSSLPFTANFSTSLSFVDISDNYLINPSLIFPWLMNSSNSLSILRMNNNGLKGIIPETFGDFSSLEELSLANNLLNGQIPVSLFHSCNLRELDLSENRLAGKFHEFVQAYSRCAQKPLQTLNMGWNEIIGMVLDLSQLSSLQVLLLDNNGLNGTIHEGIGQLSNLIELSLRNNKLEGLISEAHFSRLSNLSTLDLSHNAFVFEISTEWVPPFNLIDINLASCNLGPDFPRWLHTQTGIRRLDISQAEISSTVPNWFWELLPMMVELNLSHNHIGGKIENLPIQLRDTLLIDLSSNMFEGPIPAFLSISSQVFLSNNIFSTIDLLLCANFSKRIRFLDLSHNYLRGELPECWMDFETLVTLDLSDNYFDGNVPRSMGSLRNIQSLHLGGNNFSGEIPFLINCTKLEVFVAAQNHLSGPLPSWIGDNIPKLLILSLHSNNFHGSMPLSICNLNELRVLDLSQNNLFGNIPKCMKNLSAMATQKNSNATISHDYFDIVGCRIMVFGSCEGDNDFGVYNDSASLIWKGKMSKYGSTLGLLRSIDLSSNRLIGKIPSEIMSLVGLVSLNISRNMLSGEIPPTIGQLRLLDFLDMSRNQLAGMIPSNLSQLDRLSVLDLSYNDLSGEIPLGTQLQARDASSYIGNPKLCGAPLNKTCPIHGQQIDKNDAQVAEQFFTKGFYIALAIGFVVGFWGVCFSLILKKSWRYAYFKFLNDAYDKLYVLTAIKIAKLQMIRS